MSEPRRLIAYLLTALLLISCQSPTLLFPGSSLQGPVAVTGSFEFAQQFSILQLEVNPSAPYSVNLRVTVIDGELYVDAAKKRRWYRYLAQDKQVRVRLGGKIYPAVAVQITRPDIASSFIKGRAIFRIDPVSVP